MAQVDDHPLVMFAGKVLSEEGTPVLATVRLGHRPVTCEQPEVARDVTQTLEDGSYSILWGALTGAEGCWTLRADPNDQVLKADSVRVMGSEIPFSDRNPPDTLRITLTLQRQGSM